MSTPAPSPLPASTLGWAALPVAGAGLVDIALGAEHLRHSPVWGVALVALGALQIGWSLRALAATTPPAARTVALVLPVLAAGWLAVVVLGLGPDDGSAGGLSAADAAVAGLQLLGAAALAVLVRHGDRTAVAGGRPASGRRTAVGLVGWAAAALVASAITTPGLAATEAGVHAVPHGAHGSPVEVPGEGAGHDGH